MKLKLFASIIAITACMCLAPPGVADTSIAWLASPKVQYQVVSVKTGELIRPFGLKSNLDVRACFGVGDDRPVLGAALTHRWQIAQNASVDVGIGVIGSVRRGNPAFYFGGTIRL